MKPLFLDTSYLIALLADDDAHHAKAVAAKRAGRSPLVTTEYVLIELGDSLNHPLSRGLAAEAIELLRRDRTVRVIPASTELLEEAIALYRNRMDKAWGLTDCCSFVVMQQEGLSEALTSDQHFQQAGFKAILRE